MRKQTLWLHSHFNLIRPIHAAAAQHGGDFRIVASYHQRKYPEAMLADCFELEPAGLSDDAYAEYALGFVQRHGIDVFLPGRKTAGLARRKQDFAKLGVTLILAGGAETLDLLENKTQFCDALRGASPEEQTIVPVPGYAAGNTIEEVEQSIRDLSQRHEVVCFKPAVGIFGFGFRIIRTAQNAALLQGIGGDLIVDGIEGALAYIQERGFRPQIVMQYLEGQETSVDTLAYDGKLLRAVVRGKLDDFSRVLEDNEEMVEMTRRLVERFGLNNLFNAQFKNSGGKPYILEINGRMSGGTSMSCLSGLVLPYWGIRLATGTATPDQVPYPKTGIRVAELKQAVVLGIA